MYVLIRLPYVSPFDLQVISSVDLIMDLPKDRLYEGIPHVTSSISFTRDEWLQMKELAEQL